MRIGLPVLNDQGFANYVNALRALGAEADFACDPEVCDGLLLPGGGDVAPELYKQTPQPECGDADDDLDSLQLDALDRFVRAGRPVLGICRGHQVINVHFGGTLVQHLTTPIQHSRGDSPVDRVHLTHAAAGSFVESLYGAEFNVNSSHHQAVDALGQGLRAVQWTGDGVVEAIEHESLPVWGVQWHPERMGFDHPPLGTVSGDAVLKWFLERCRAR